MKVYFYFDNSRKNNVDFSNPEKGNPGIGGTEFMIWSISYYLNLYYDDIEVTILAPIIENLPIKINKIKCESIYDAVVIASDMIADILVLRGTKCEDTKVYNLIDELKVKTIMWCHNFETYNYLKLASKTNYIKRNICVSKEQYDRLRDHEIFKKSDYLFNGIDCSLYNSKDIDKRKENIACYLGAIRPLKGFHKLAEIWHKVQETVPGCKLYVIGSGKLYDDNAKLGKYGIAEESYEKTFIKYLLDDNKKIRDDIEFLGDLAHDKKIEVMSKSKVGILNPIAKDETFCISAIEFEALGIPVVAKKTYGLLNTVKNRETGFLIKNDNELIKSIIKLLTDDDLNKTMGKEGIRYVNSNFDIKRICGEWRSVLYQIKNDEMLIRKEKTENYMCDLKWIREINRRIKQVKIFREIPAIVEYPDVIYSNRYYRSVSNIKNKMLGN